MVRKMLRAGVFAALGMIAVMASYGVATTAEDKTADVKTIMDKSFKNKDSFKATISADAKEGKWDDAKKLAKDWVDLSASIGKNKPAKGDDASWQEQCKKFVDSTKAVYDATDSKDAKAVGKALGSFNCGGCHKAHR
jgi:hypothetical protein